MTYTESINTLKQARKSQGITQVALANKLGISKGYLCNIEKGVYIPKADMLFKMAEVLNVKVTFEVTEEIDDCLNLEGVFLIEAKTEETFYNRKRKLEEITGFSTIGFDSYEEDEEYGGAWKIITTAYHSNIEETKRVIAKMKKFKWLFLSDSYILLGDKYVFSNGNWK